MNETCDHIIKDEKIHKKHTGKWNAPPLPQGKQPKLRRHYIAASFEIALRTTSTLADFPLNTHLWLTSEVRNHRR